MLTLMALVAAATTLVAGPAGASGAPRAEDEDPLAVSIDSLSPSVVPAKGPLVVTGRVTNTSTEEWQAINVYPLFSTAPLTTPEQLTEALDLDPKVEVGERELSVVDQIPVLGPGESAPYRLRLPHAVLPTDGEQGVYWFQVHALGQTAAGREPGADGRARTFLPLVRGRRTLDTALVLPVRRPVRYSATGRVVGLGGWLRDLETGGTLASSLTIAQGAGIRPVTWLVDPAVPAAAARLADGNPGFALGPTGAAADQGQGEGDGSGTPEPSPSDGQSLALAPESAQSSTAAEATRRAARTWLDAAGRAMVGDELLALPYGDVDVMAASRSDPDLLALAGSLNRPRMAPWGEPAAPAVSPAAGLLSGTVLAGLPAETTVLLRDLALTRRPDRPTAAVPALARIGDRTVLLSSTSAAAGGPGPGDPLATTSLRQRILAEAAVRRLSGAGPLVVTLPDGWRPDVTAAGRFFGGLDVPWVRLTTLSDLAASHRGRVVDPERVRYPDRLQAFEVSPVQLSEVSDLVAAGRRLDAMLPATDSVADQVARAALPAASYAARRQEVRARTSVARMRAWITRQLGKVELAAPSSVTLSSDTGSLATSVTNNLDQPVRVRVLADIGDRNLTIEPSDVVEIDPGGRADLLLEAHSSVLGVHEVTLRVTDEEGQPLGSSATFPISSAQVSDVIWVVMGVGVAILFGAIVVRNVRRIRGRGGRGDEPADDVEPEPAG